MSIPFSLENRTILITGASSGIGRATAIECSKMGAKLIITGRNEQRLKETLSMLDGTDHTYMVCDFSLPENVNSFVDSLPALDGVVNNAGISILSPISFIKEADLNEIFQVNTLTPILLLKSIVKKKKINKGGSVVFTSSMAPFGGSVIGNSVYTSSKGAISAFVQNAALELGQKQIRVNAVCPGMTDTPMIHNNMEDDSLVEEDVKKYALGRYARPEEIAWSIIFLLSNASGFVTGVNLYVDGGFSVS